MKISSAPTKFFVCLSLASLTGFLAYSSRSSLFPSTISQTASPALQSSKATGAVRKTGKSKSQPTNQKAESRLPQLLANQELARRLEREREEMAERLKRQDQPDGAMEFFRLKRAPVGERTIPVERYLMAREQMRVMPQFSTAQSRFLPSREAMVAEPEQLVLGTWTPLGPGNIGGRTRRILIHPTSPNIMYTAGVAGGVWRTTNSGATWTPLADLIANIAVNSLAMDPSNPNVLYAGTGEGYFNIDGVRGAGIFKTTDGGANWSQLLSTNTLDFQYVNDLVVSPVNSNRVYAGTRTGVWRSTDGGANWTRVLNPSIQGGCLDLAIRTDQSTDYLFAACGTFVQATIYRNTDAAGSGTWTAVLTESQMGRTTLAIAPSNQNIIYALASSNAGGQFEDGLHAVFRSTSSGDPGSWTAQVRNTDSTQLNTVLLSNTVFAFGANCGLGSNQFYNQGWYDNVIAVDPADPNRVWAGGIDLFRSDDGGQNWGIASYWWAGDTNPAYVHADNHTIVFHPQYNGTTNRTMFVAGDGGIFRTDDARAPIATGNSAACNTGNTGMQWKSLNNNYGVTQFYHGLPYPNGTTYFGGTQDNGTLRGTDSGGVNAWVEIHGGDGGYVAIDPTNTQILYAGNTGLSIRKSTDGGASFAPATNGITNAGFLFISPFIMDPTSAQRLWTGGSALWRTSDAATSWTQASTNLAGGSVSAIAVAPSNANHVLAGTSSGFIHRTDIGLTSNSGTAWPAAQPRTGYVSWVAFDPNNASIAYATYSSFGGTHVWRSTDGGASWTGIDGSGASGIPDIPVHSIVVDPNDSARLYLGTDLGVFTSTDSGATWAVENTGFANVVVESLALNTVGGATSLYAFTHGRGAWRVTVSTSNCAFTLNSTSQSFIASGGTGSVNVTAGAGCTWTAASNESWITISSGNSGTGNGTVNYSVAANPSTNPRTGMMTIAGQSFTVTQAGAPSCSYTLSHISQNFPRGGGTSSLRVTAPAGCAWTATSNANWITITSGSNGSGNRTVTFSVAFYFGGGASRTGTLTIAGRTFTITQQIFFSCNYSLASTGRSFSASGGTASVSVNAGGGCLWTAASNAGWITILAGAGSSGNGMVDYSVALNNTSNSRTGTMTIAGQTFTITQAPGAKCNYSLSSTSQSFAASGGPDSVNVTSSANCSWTATSNDGWITITSGGSGTGNGAVNYSVAANTGPTRSGTMTIAGQTFTVMQASGCSFTLNPTGQSFAAAGGAGSANVAAGAGCAWTAASNDSWITITGGSNGSGNGTVNYSVGANNTLNQRTGTMTIAGQTFTITQDPAPPCTFTLSATGQSFGSGGGAGSVNLTAGAGCAWTAVSNESWITITSGSSGTGNGTVNYSVAANASLNSRVGMMTIAGQTFTITQAGASSCSYTLSHTGQTFPKGGGTSSLRVTAPAGCAWTATSNATWVTITSGNNGAGTGTVTFSVNVNFGRTPRSATLIIAGQAFTVNQVVFFGCTSSLSSTGQSFTAAGGAASVSVNAGATCPWTAASNDSWITILAGAGGSGNGMVDYSVEPNNSPNARTGTLTIAGLTFTVTQSGTGGTVSGSATLQSLIGRGEADITLAVDEKHRTPWEPIKVQQTFQFAEVFAMNRSRSQQQTGKFAATFSEELLCENSKHYLI
jgi:hypothetical protein